MVFFQINPGERIIFYRFKVYVVQKTSLFAYHSTVYIKLSDASSSSAIALE